MQTETESQIKNAQNQTTDIQKLMETKLRNLEKENLLLQKKYAVLEERFAQTNQQFEKEKQQKEEIFQYEMDKKIKKIQTEKQQEIESFIQKIQNLESLYNETNSYKTKTEAALQHEKTISEELSEKANKLKSNLKEMEHNKRVLVQHLDEANQNITRLKQILEDQKREKKRQEEEGRNLQGLIAEQSMQLQQIQIDMERQSAQMQNEMAIYKQRTEKDIQVELQKSQDLKQQLEELSIENVKLKHEKETLVKQLEHNLSTSEQQIQELEQNLNKSKEMSSEQLKQETLLHAETKNVLIRSDTLNQQLKSYTTELEQKYQVSQEQIKVLEKQIKQQAKQQIENQNDLQKYRKMNQELHKKIEFIQYSVAEKRNKLVKTLATKLNSLKTQILNTKTFLISQIEIQNKENSVKLQELIIIIKEKTESIRRAYACKLRVQDELSQKDMKGKIQEIQVEHKNYIKQLQQDFDKKVKTLKQENDSLQQQNITFQIQYQNSQEANQSLQDKIYQYEQSKCELSSLNENLKRELEQQQLQFESLRVDLKYEADKLKQESDNLVEVICNKLDKKHKKEIESIQEELLNQKKQFQEQSQLYQTRMEQIEVTHNQELENQIVELEEKSKNDLWNIEQFYKQQIQQLQKGFQELNQKQISWIENLEQQSDFMIQGIQKDKEEYLFLRQERDKEVFNLTERLKQMQIELTNRTKYCEQLSKERELARSQMRELKRQLDVKELQLSQKLNEVVQARTDKEKELQELKSLLNQMPERQAFSEQQFTSQQKLKYIQTPKYFEEEGLSISQLRNKDQ